MNYGFKDIVIRTATDPHVLATHVDRALHRLDAEMPFAEVHTIDEVVEQQTGGARLTAILLGVSPSPARYSPLWASTASSPFW